MTQTIQSRLARMILDSRAILVASLSNVVTGLCLAPPAGSVAGRGSLCSPVQLIHAPHLREFPRTLFAGNSSQCIKRRPFKDTAAIQWPLDTCARRVWSSKLLRSVLSVLGLVTARNTGRILMQDAA